MPTAQRSIVYIVRYGYGVAQMRVFSSLSAAVKSCRRSYGMLGELQFSGTLSVDGDVMVVGANGGSLCTITQSWLTDTPSFL